MSESLLSKQSFVAKLIKSKKFRDSYSYELVRTGIPFQMRALRDQREWKQADLAREAEKPRSVITRLESPGYGKLTLKSLFEIASAFEVALMVKFVPFSRLVREYEDVSPQALIAAKITDKEEALKLEAWALATMRSPEKEPEETHRPRFDQIFSALQEGHQKKDVTSYEEFLRRKRSQSEKSSPRVEESPLARAASGGAQ